jgi:signal transduction histidine kinase
MNLVIKEMRLLAGNKDIQILNYIDPFINKELIGDVTRLRQILNNLINNAVKFTETGYVFFNVKKIYSTAYETKLEFSVEDTGSGISDEFKNIIFSEFTQEEDTYTKNYGGTGLGLAISKRLVRLMGGDIWAESEKGKGSTFYFTLVFENIKDDMETLS